MSLLRRPNPALRSARSNTATAHAKRWAWLGVLTGLVVGLIGERPSVTLPLLGQVRSWQLVFLLLGAELLPHPAPHAG